MALGVNSQASDYIAQVRRLIHDPNGSDYTDAQLLELVNEARSRVAQDARCVRQMITGLNTIVQQETYPLTNYVGGVNVLNGGTNYTNPTITVTDSSGLGTGAAAVAVPTNGVLTTALTNMTSWGGNYINPSTVTMTVSDPTGTGAVLQPIVGANIIDIYTMTVLWNGPPAALAVTYDWLPFGAFQAFCRAYRGNFSNPGAWTAHYGPISPTSQTANAQMVYHYPIPNSTYPLEIDAITLPFALTATTSVDYQLLMPWNDAVQYFAAHLAYLGLSQWAAADTYLGIYERRLRQLGATGFARRVHSFFYSFRSLIRKM